MQPCRQGARVTNSLSAVLQTIRTAWWPSHSLSLSTRIVYCMRKRTSEIEFLFLNALASKIISFSYLLSHEIQTRNYKLCINYIYNWYKSSWILLGTRDQVGSTLRICLIYSLPANGEILEFKLDASPLNGQKLPYNHDIDAFPSYCFINRSYDQGSI